MLYPIKFYPIFKEKIWGGKKLHSILNKKINSAKTGESWEVSGVKNNLSIICNGKLKGKNIIELIEIYKSDFLGKKVYSNFGIYFPLLIKFIDANDDLSVQVHPDDVFAKLKHNENGKTEMWYILDADKDTDIILGVNKNITKSEFIQHINENKIKDILNYEKINKGDAFYIPAGRIHAIMKGTLLAEIQQNSDLTYRIYDWNRKGLDGKYRELHTELATEVVDLKKEDNYFIEQDKNNKNYEGLVANKFFTVNILSLEKNKNQNLFNIDSFVIYICIEGYLSFKYKNKDYDLQKGETILIPAIINEIGLFPKKETKLLEIYIN